jgi:gentisate 1,2-dioxygenase
MTEEVSPSLDPGDVVIVPDGWRFHVYVHPDKQPNAILDSLAKAFTFGAVLARREQRMLYFADTRDQPLTLIRNCHRGM